MAFVRVEPSEPEFVIVTDLDRPAPRPDPRLEAERVASALGEVIGNAPRGVTRGVSRRGFLQGVGAASTVALSGGYLLKIVAPERVDALAGWRSSQPHPATMPTARATCSRCADR